MSDYPEHDKLSAVSDESQTIGAFLDTSGYTLCEWKEDIDQCEDCGEEHSGFVPVPGSINKILAKHFGIDLDVLEAEKRAMLDAIRTPK